ncbi:hypothetical protein [Actinoplanes sp. GCM10030250]|uniref:hypothetical protein n=1 Tax=Actinoplanes sp. GCM10030250 TaxID=3273376 RepID=UPI0036187A7B
MLRKAFTTFGSGFSSAAKKAPPLTPGTSSLLRLSRAPLQKPRTLSLPPTASPFGTTARQQGFSTTRPLFDTGGGSRPPTITPPPTERNERNERDDRDAPPQPPRATIPFIIPIIGSPGDSDEDSDTEDEDGNEYTDLAEPMAEFVQDEFGVQSDLVKEFPEPYAWLNDYTGPDGALKLAEAIGKNPELLKKLAEAALADGEKMDGGLGKTIRMDVKHHAYLILSQQLTANSELARQFFSKETEAQKQIEALAGCFPAGGAFGPEVTLGYSGKVVPSHLTKVDLGNGRTATCCLMTTGKWHALDGHLMWIMFHDANTNTFSYSAFGTGKHPMPIVDTLNPILGGAMMNTMAKRLSVLLDKAATLIGMTPEKMRNVIKAADPALDYKSQALRVFDAFAVPISAYRQDVGGNTVAIPKT